MINKRIAAAGLAGSVIVMSVAAQAKNVEVKSDGCVDLTGEGAAENSVVTIELVPDIYDLSDKSTWADFTDDGTATGFMGAVTADENGKYEFNIYLKKSGRYTVRLGNSNFDGIKEEKLWFVNKDAMAKKLTELKEAAKTDNVSAIKDVLLSNRFDMGLFAKVGDDADCEKAAEALAAYLKNNQTAVTEDNISVIGEKACVVSLLGNENFGGFSKYADGFGLGNLKVSKYYKEAYATEFTKMMKKDNPTSVKAYDDSIQKNVILCLIKLGDSSGDVKNCLELCASDIGLGKSYITTDMCKALMKASNINSYEDIKNFAESYKSDDKGSSGGHQGGGGYSGKPTNTNTNIGDKTFSDEYVPKGYDEEALVFDDMEGYDWAIESVQGLFAKGIVSGRESGKFVPNDNVLREEFVKMIVKSFELSVVGDKPPFKDVDENDWYNQFVVCAYNSGIVSGYSDTEFGIGDAVSREDIAVMILRAIDVCDYTLKNTEAGDITFNDEGDISDYAKDAVKKLAQAGIINGDENGNFNPKQSATRAETAKILWTTLQNSVK